ncbi:hypothetical protein sphantq_04470 (plasmid) [Sphingobium sp. AntQ-1]|nr:hypothetical protein [Sphingobium sp. AntQ-1]WCP15978.1 hypothetical protein sphantq_04470 [Sphingobium sp. AntQ-1]
MKKSEAAIIVPGNIGTGLIINGSQYRRNMATAALDIFKTKMETAA